MASEICYVCGTRNMRGSVCLTCCPDGDPRLKPANTRPAPAATDTGLVTVGYQYHDGAWYYAANPDKLREFGFKIRELVTRSQAVELLAAEISRERDLAAKQLSEVVDRMSDDYLALKADNAAKAARIKELDAAWLSAEKQCQSQGEQLAAAEKALEPFVSFFNEAMKGFTEGYAERTPSDKPVFGYNDAYLLIRHFIEASAALGGKPS